MRIPAAVCYRTDYTVHVYLNWMIAVICLWANKPQYSFSVAASQATQKPTSAYISKIHKHFLTIEELHVWENVSLAWLQNIPV